MDGRVRRRSFLALAGAATAAAVAATRPALGKPGHGHGHGPPPTTTAPTTTTGGAVPTTFTTPTVVQTTGLPACGTPVTLTAGGQIIGGCIESTDPATPAVTIATTAPVVLDHVLIRHRGHGVFAQATSNTNVQMTNCTFVCTLPAAPTDSYACYLFQPASVVFERNRLVDGHGFLVNGNATNCAPFRVRYNDYIDVGRWGGAESFGMLGAVHFDQVLASSGAEVAWNRIVSHYGRSRSEDVIGIHESSGASGNLIEIHHNLIDGSYPSSGDGNAFTGGGIDLGDGATTGGTFQTAHDNTVVRVTNNGLMIPAGTDLEHHHNRVITSGMSDNGTRVSSSFGNGLNLWDNPGYPVTPLRCSMHDNTGDHRRWTGAAWERSWQNTPACDPAGACTGNTNDALTLTDDAAWLAAINTAIAAWETARAAAGVTVGPL